MALRETSGLGDIDIGRMIEDLVSTILLDATGGLYPSIYETARLVRLAPWLEGHGLRIQFLLDEQNADGSWGGPAGYSLVPTLSATESLLSALATGDGSGDGTSIARGILAAAARRGCEASIRQLERAARSGVASTVVSIFVVPALVQAINEQLANNASVAAATEMGGRQLRLPPSMTDALLMALRKGGWRSNPLVAHYLEVVGSDAARAPMLDPGTEFVGCSPAATAAWIGEEAPTTFRHPAVQLLEALQARNGGPVPALTSVSIYERAWVLDNLVTAGVDLATVRRLAADLPESAGKAGAPTAVGLPHEAETTSIVLCALGHAGTMPAPTFLWQYDAGTHFMATIPEKYPSTSTNAHIIQTMGTYLRGAPPDAPRYADAISRIGRWLGDNQHADGYWTDKWHASPLFATMCCAEALRQYGNREHTETIERAIRWIVSSQRSDGSWGEWESMVEETAFAVRALLQVCEKGRADAELAAARGCRFILQRGMDVHHPALWIGKELYAPVHILRGAILGTLYLAKERFARR